MTPKRFGAYNLKYNAMKRILLTVSVAALSILSIACCSQQAKWNRQERQAMRNLLRDYRDMVYLNDLTDAEYMLFSDNVTSRIEKDYPLYTTFVQMPGVNDTVQVYLLAAIVGEIDTDARNMRHIYPYRSLVDAGILPSGLDRAEQNAFYNCLSQKVDETFPTAGSFVNAVISDTAATSRICRMQQQCASDLFDWTAEGVGTSETDCR